MTTIRLRQALLTIGLMGGLWAWSVKGEEPSIVFDNRPEMGIPPRSNGWRGIAKRPRKRRGWPPKDTRLNSTR